VVASLAGASKNNCHSLLAGKVQFARVWKAAVDKSGRCICKLLQFGENFLQRINDAEHLKSDVIGTASIFSQLDESATCRLRRLRGERLLYLTRIHLAPQSVGADHQDIAFMEQ
jgi:hypothetical protein